MSQDYSNRELDEKFESIIEKLDAIHAQTLRTNGRVSNLENWRWFITGGLAIITLIVLPIALQVVHAYIK